MASHLRCAALASGLALALSDGRATAQPAAVYLDPEAALRAQQRQQRLAERAAIRAARLALREHLARHHAQHRVFAYAGLSPLLIAQAKPGADDSRQRLRQQAVVLGAAYRHNVVRYLGVHAGSSIGIGRTRLVLARNTGGAIDGGDKQLRDIGPSYALDFEGGLSIGPFPHLYLQPACNLRTVIVPHPSRVLTVVDPYDEEDVLTARVRFPRGQLLAGGRMMLGVLLGRNHQVDLAFGLDAGKVVSSPGPYVGLSARLGMAFGDWPD